MYFDSLAAAWDMAGHGPFVWSAYVLTFGVLVCLVVAPVRKFRAGIRGIKADLHRRRHDDSPAGKPLESERSAHPGDHSHAS